VASDGDLASVRAVEAANEVEHGAFAGAAGAHDGYEFAFVDGERHVFDRVDGVFAHFVVAANVVELDYYWGGRCRDCLGLGGV
jgi:hypothetical protein